MSLVSRNVRHRWSAIWDLTLAEVVPYEEMSISLGAAAVGALAALVFAGLLARRCIRAPRLATVALLLATVALALALGAQAGGYYHGFGGATFRAVQIGAELIAPLALTWALAELTGKSMGARFASRLALGAVTVVGAVVLATDPLGSAAFSKTWPAASVHYQIIPNGVLKFVAVVTALAAVISLIVTGVRARQSAGWQTLFLAVAAIAVASVLLDVLRLKLPANSAYAVICVGAAALAWFAARRASAVRLESLRTGGFAWDEDTGSFVRYRDEDTGDFGYADDTESSRERSPQGRPTPGAGTATTPAASAATSPTPTCGDGSGPARRAAAPGASRPTGATPPTAAMAVTGSPMPARRPAMWRTKCRRARLPTARSAPLPLSGRAARTARATAAGSWRPARCCRRWRITTRCQSRRPWRTSPGSTGRSRSTTLLDETADDFERLASEVVEQVKTREPDTLVYVMHGVPAAPMQRILYAIYRDEAAFDRHERQPYIRQFEEEREPYVLATNVIELGVRHAKFTPLAAQRQPRARRSGHAATVPGEHGRTRHRRTRHDRIGHGRTGHDRWRPGCRLAPRRP